MAQKINGSSIEDPETPRSAEVLADFTEFCRLNPRLRFWQALWVWSGQAVLLTSHERFGQEVNAVLEGEHLPEFQDPFLWEGKDG